MQGVRRFWGVIHSAHIPGQSNPGDVPNERWSEPDLGGCEGKEQRDARSMRFLRSACAVKRAVHFGADRAGDKQSKTARNSPRFPLIRQLPDRLDHRSGIRCSAKSFLNGTAYRYRNGRLGVQEEHDFSIQTTYFLFDVKHDGIPRNA
jgi:hypothetical protein